MWCAQTKYYKVPQDGGCQGSPNFPNSGYSVWFDTLWCRLSEKMSDNIFKILTTF